MGRPEFASLAIVGDGAYFVSIDLIEAPHARLDRYDDEEPDLRGAVTADGSDLSGGLKDGRSIFELNSFAPPGVVESDGDRCILASLEFHSVQMTNARGGIIYLRGFLSAAEAYSQDVFDRIAAGTPLEEICEMASEHGGIKYRPPKYVPLQDYLGREATIRLVPRKAT